MTFGGKKAYLTYDELKLLHIVLEESGYSDGIISAEPREFSSAARLLIMLFQEGTTSPDELKIELQRRFGRPTEPLIPTENFSDQRYAIQGIPVERPKDV